MTDSAPKLLTFATTGRNDDYMGDFKGRLSTCLNYLARGLRLIGRTDQVEVLVTDWNSDSPLGDALSLTSEAAALVRFVRVPPAEARKKMREGQSFNGPCAANAAIRRAASSFVMFHGADTLWPAASLDTLLKLLAGELPLPWPAETCLFLCGRKMVPWRAVQTAGDLIDWDRYIALHAGELPRERWWPGLGMCASAQLMHRDLWRACRGYNEALGDWGWSDAELTLRVTQRHPWMELLSFGVVTLDMEHHRAPGAGERPPIKMNPYVISPTFEANDEDWGLGRLELAVESPAPRGGAAESPAREADAGWSWTEAWEALTAQSCRDIVGRVVAAEQGISASEWAGLCAAAWFARQQEVRCCVDIGVSRSHAADVLVSLCPEFDFFGIDPWTDESAPTPDFLCDRLHQAGYRGYARFVTGPAETACERLRQSWPADEEIDWLVLRTGVPGLEPDRVWRTLAPLLARRAGVVVIAEPGEEYLSAWAAFRGEAEGVLGFSCPECSVGLGLRADCSPEDAARETTAAEQRALAELWRAPAGRPGLLTRGRRRLRRALRRLERWLDEEQG